MPGGLHVLVVEDSRALGESIRELLTSHGHRADLAADGRAGLQMALAEPPDVLVLDLSLPGMDGLRLCARLRAECDRHVPVLMLTARDTLPDKLAGFEAGADDYLLKPFANEELLARCHALSQRHRAGQAHLLRIGTLVIDRREGTVTRAGRPLALRQTARQLLLVLAEAWPRAVTRSELVRRVWGDDPPESDPLRTHLYGLRQVLDKPFATPMLVTIHEVGFRLQADA
ncbi:MAG: response regulator transcription factor [Gemmatimonadaceae bacterium]|jgi:DNA-binding response OmpR family regulator|nr:response regulator transcription factor [Gemmatimonadaceae bacterium]